MSEIISILFGVLMFFVPGYIFLSCYNFVSCSRREDKAHYIIIKCIAISFVFSLGAGLINSLFILNEVLLLILDLVAAALLGLLFGRLHRCRLFKKLVNKLFRRGFANSEFVELWETAIIEKHHGVYLQLKLKNDENTYEGLLDTVIAVNSDPKIFLTRYICTTPNGNEIRNYADDPDFKMVIKTSNIERFEFRYITMEENP